MPLYKRRENQLPYFTVLAQVCFWSVYTFLSYSLVLMGKNSLKVDTCFLSKYANSRIDLKGN